MADSPHRSGAGPSEAVVEDGAHEAEDTNTTVDTSLTYHRSGDGDQILLGIETEEVRVSVAFEEGTSRTVLEAALAAQRRELDHYYATTSGSR